VKSDVPKSALVNDELEIALNGRSLIDNRAIAADTHSESGIERLACRASQIDLDFARRDRRCWQNSSGHISIAQSRITSSDRSAKKFCGENSHEMLAV
jgi:hypothetical protein